MKQAFRIAGIGLLAGAAVTAAGAGLADQRGGGFGPRGDMAGLAMMNATFASLDADGSGQITEEDLAARAAARFAEVDLDGDGSVSLEELTAHVTGLAEARRAAYEEVGEEAPRRPLMARRGMDPERMALVMLGRMDADSSGTLELEEMTGRVDYARFIDRFDTDDDNALSEAEYTAARAEAAARMADRPGPGGPGGREGHGGPGGRDDR